MQHSQDTYEIREEVTEIRQQPAYYVPQVTTAIPMSAATQEPMSSYASSAAYGSTAVYQSAAPYRPPTTYETTMAYGSAAYGPPVAYNPPPPPMSARPPYQVLWWSSVLL